jgi:hypothetical protein
MGRLNADTSSLYIANIAKCVPIGCILSYRAFMKNLKEVGERLKNTKVHQFKTICNG